MFRAATGENALTLAALTTSGGMRDANRGGSFSVGHANGGRSFSAALTRRASDRESPKKTMGAAAASDLKSSAETLHEQMESLIERLERILESDVKDAGVVGAARPVERLPNRPIIRAARTSAERLGEQDIANLVQEALEDDAPDRKLTQIVAALGLLMASLNSPPRK